MTDGKIQQEGEKRQSILSALPVVAVIYIVLFAIAGFGFALVSIFEWNIKLKLPPQIVLFLNDLPMIALAMIFGASGALIRNITIASREVGGLARNLEGSKIIVGALIGVLAFLVLESKAIVQLVYADFPKDVKDLSYHGVALVAAIAGMFSYELVGAAETRANGFLANGNTPPESQK